VNWKHMLACVSVIAFAACSGGSGGQSASSSQPAAQSAGGGAQLTGAGSTFDYPFFSKAFYQYNQQHPSVQINYQSIGSGGGIQQFTAKTVDFGATDVPMNASELARASSPVLQIPVALGGEAISYNLPTMQSPLRFTGPLLAQIYLGKVKDWSDPAIARLNPNAHLAKMPIVVVHRSDGSGTTYIFTDYLSSVSPDWKSSVGAAKSVQWPAQNSVGGKGNEGVAGVVRNTPGAIGYIELAYAVENHMPAALVQNRDGKWVAPTKATVAAAAAAKPNVTATNFSIVNQPGANSYPIAGYSWALLYGRQSDAQRGKLIKDVFSWLTGPEGQSIAGGLEYVPLPANIQTLAHSSIGRVKV
jgi:phosphate transport system substrate-binding protein